VHPILYRFEILGHERVIAGYGIMITLALLVGVATAVVLARRRGLHPVDMLLVALMAIGAGLVGSYLLFMLTMAREIIGNPAMAMQGGLVFYGGPLAAAPVAWIAAKRFGMAPLKVADIAAPALSLAHALGRLGCFLGGCCYGRPWEGPLSVKFQNFLAPAAHPPIPRHPVQLYESAVLLVIALATLLLWRRSRRPGQIALLYVLLYGSWRFVAEMLRGDALRGFIVADLLSTSQLISLLILPCCLVALVWLHRRPRTQ